MDRGTRFHFIGMLLTEPLKHNKPHVHQYTMARDTPLMVTKIYSW